MASAKMRYIPPRGRRVTTDHQAYASFMADLLDGTIEADDIEITRGPQGRLQIDFKKTQGQSGNV